MVAFTKFLRSPERFALSLVLALLALVVVGSGCATTKGRPMTADNMVPPVLLLSAGDVLDITFLGNTNFSGMRRIGPEGSLSMPTIGTVQAAGKTAAELEAE